jgi:hypothetical protein
MVDEIRGNRTIVPTSRTNTVKKCKRVHASSPPVHGMQTKAKRLDRGTMLIDMRNHVYIITGALGGKRHRNAMSHEIPILSHEKDQYRVWP